MADRYSPEKPRWMRLSGDRCSLYDTQILLYFEGIRKPWVGGICSSEFTWKLKGEGHFLALHEGSRAGSPRVPVPAKELLQSREVSGSLEDDRASCLPPANAPRSILQAHPKQVPFPPLPHCFLSLALPLALIPILLYKDESIRHRCRMSPNV